MPLILFFVAQAFLLLTIKHVQIPFEWQENVIRACITLKLLTYQETGAIVAAATTSIPREAQSKLQDLRYCRVEDMPHIIRTLNRYPTTAYHRYLSRHGAQPS